MRFEVYEPFEVPRKDTRHDFSNDALRDFWQQVEEADEGLSLANGIYVYSSRHGSTYTPWYVGKNCSSGGFRTEVFGYHKREVYRLTEDRITGARFIHLIPRLVAGGSRFSGPSESAKRDIDQLEDALIGMAWAANRDVQNQKKTWFNKNIIVPGIMGKPTQGRKPQAQKSLRHVLGLG